MLDDKFIQEFILMCKVNRKIREDSIGSTIKYILNSIEYFNSFGEYNQVLDDPQVTRFSDVPILNEFKDFVFPRSVRFEPGNLRTKDLLIRPAKDESFKFDFPQYIIMIDDFRRYYKSDSKSNVTDLATLKRHVSFNEILPLTWVESNGHRFMYTGTDVALPVNIDTSFYSSMFEDSLFDSDFDSCIYNYMHKSLSFG